MWRSPPPLVRISPSTKICPRTAVQDLFRKYCGKISYLHINVHFVKDPEVYQSERNDSEEVQLAEGSSRIQVQDKRPSMVMFNIFEENTEHPRQTRPRPSIFSVFSHLAGGSCLLTFHSCSRALLKKRLTWAAAAASSTVVECKEAENVGSVYAVEADQAAALARLRPGAC